MACNCRAKPSFRLVLPHEFRFAREQIEGCKNITEYPVGLVYEFGKLPDAQAFAKYMKSTYNMNFTVHKAG